MNKIDYLIKIGGSLIENSERFNDLIDYIENLGKTKKIVLTTGSKYLSNVIRKYIKEIFSNPINTNTHVNITMKSRDAIATALSDTRESFLAVNSIKQIYYAHNNNRIPLIIQYDLLKKLKPFKLERGLSTDTTSAYFAKLLNVGKFIKLTNVDGIYSNYGYSNEIIRNVIAKQLINSGESCVDQKLASFLFNNGLDCYVINGYNIGNLDKFIKNNGGVYTKINSK